MPLETLHLGIQFGAQFGMAGLIGWMWLVERRAGAIREKQLTDLHERIMEERRHVSTLLSVISANTKALTALEVGQRTLTRILDRLAPINVSAAPC